MLIIQKLPLYILPLAGLVLSNLTFAQSANDPGPYRAPLKPAVVPKKGLKSQATVPTEVEVAIKAAAKTGDIYSVTQPRQSFDGQILKVDVLVFQERTALVMTKFDVPWVAIVARKVQFVAPESNNSIVTETTWTPRRHNPPNAPGTPGKKPKAPECENGGSGDGGANGLIGTNGDSAPQPPKVYLIAGAIVNKFDVPLPEAFNFIFDLRGYSGGEAGNGGQGGAGGSGGDGGPGDWHDPASYPLDPGCKCGAGFGGPGSTGGRGGPGGTGGNSSAGASIAWVATQSVLDSLYFSRIYNQGGFGGPGGLAGPSGQSGPGGARGEWEGGCKGGGPGKTPLTAATPPDPSPKGSDSPRGVITREAVANIDRFY